MWLRWANVRRVCYAVDTRQHLSPSSPSPPAFASLAVNQLPVCYTPSIAQARGSSLRSATQVVVMHAVPPHMYHGARHDVGISSLTLFCALVLLA
jgi:hypothetical protein